MIKIRLTYIITEITLIAALLWATLNLSFFADDFEVITDLARLVSSFGITMLLVGSKTFRENFPKQVLIGFLFFTALIYNLEKVGFERYVGVVAPKTLQSSFAKVMAMQLVPADTSLSERIYYRVGIELMDTELLSERLNTLVGKGNTIDPIEHRITLEANNYNNVGFYPKDPYEGYRDNDLLEDIESAYLNALLRSTKLYKKAVAWNPDVGRYEDYVLDYLRESTFSSNKETIGGLIWLWYLQSEGKVSMNRLVMLRQDLDYDDFRRTRVLPKIHQMIKSNGVSLNEPAFHRLGGSRYIGETSHLLWLMTTVGIMIALVSLLLNALVLFGEIKNRTSKV